MPVFKIIHVTKYLYSWSIKESINEIRLYPYNFENQDVLQHQLLISNNPNVDISQDYYGNRVGNFNILEEHNEMVIESRMLVRVNNKQKIPKLDTVKIKDIGDEVEGSVYLQRLCSPEVIKEQKQIDQILEKINLAEGSIISIAQECSKYIFKNFSYTKGITDVETTLDKILTIRQGVCQDFAHVLLQLLRTAGIPSRYVSGYICPNDSNLRGEGATHAWVEFYSPSFGWLGVDPTNNIWATDKHVKLSVGRDFRDCTLVKGTFKGIAKQSLSVSVSIGYKSGRLVEELNNVELRKVTLEEQEQIDYLEQHYLQLQLQKEQQQQ